MTWNLAIQITGAASAFVSGVLWFTSASIRYPMGVSYLDRAPDDVIQLMTKQAALNRWAALSAGVTGFCSALTLGLQILGLAAL